jgi:hypothetical protein
MVKAIWVSLLIIVVFLAANLTVEDVINGQGYYLDDCNRAVVVHWNNDVEPLFIFPIAPEVEATIISHVGG